MLSLVTFESGQWTYSCCTILRVTSGQVYSVRTRARAVHIFTITAGLIFAMSEKFIVSPLPTMQFLSSSIFHLSLPLPPHSLCVALHYKWTTVASSLIYLSISLTDIYIMNIYIILYIIHIHSRDCLRLSLGVLTL